MIDVILVIVALAVGYCVRWYSSEPHDFKDALENLRDRLPDSEGVHTAVASAFGFVRKHGWVVVVAVLAIATVAVVVWPRPPAIPKLVWGKNERLDGCGNLVSFNFTKDDSLKDSIVYGIDTSATNGRDCRVVVKLRQPAISPVTSDQIVK